MQHSIDGTQILFCTIKTERGHRYLSRCSFFLHFKMETKRMSSMRMNPSFIFAEGGSSEIFETSYWGLRVLEVKPLFHRKEIDSWIKAQQDGMQQNWSLSRWLTVQIHRERLKIYFTSGYQTVLFSFYNFFFFFFLFVFSSVRFQATHFPPSDKAFLRCCYPSSLS